MSGVAPLAWRTRAALAAVAVVGLGLCLFLTFERWFGGGGCVRGWFFNCAAVRQSAVAHLAGVPTGAWGAAWFVLVGALALSGRAWRWPALALVAPGLVFVIFLRGVELFLLGAACLLCWGVALCALAAGIPLLWRAISPMPSRPRWTMLSVLLALAVGACAAPRWMPWLRPAGEPIALPGWQAVSRGAAPMQPSDLLVCGGERPTVVFVYDPTCDDCHTLAEGLLSEERTNLFLSELCRVIVTLDDIAGSPIDALVPRTPTLLVYRANGELAGSLTTEDITEERLLELVGQAFGGA